MEISRTLFLERQLGAFLPREIISIIRDYDAIYRDYFSEKIVANLNLFANDFWEKKINSYAKSRACFDDPQYRIKMENYYEILWNVMVIPINYGGECKCGRKTCSSGMTATGLMTID